MLKAVVLTTCLLIATHNAAAQSDSECRHPKLEGKCEKKSCIPRVTGTSISWNEVKPKSFYVRWKPNALALCYYVELLQGYTIAVLKTVSCFRGSGYEFTGLKPSMIYGVRVSMVTRGCIRGQSGIPARTRTLWAPTARPTTKPFINRTPAPGACGKRFFTCHSDENECVSIKKWCNRVWDCKDGSDERGCTGGCEEIDIDFKSGNYSCTRWGSPGSVCEFECQDEYVRDGALYTVCSRRKGGWTNPIPTCRLPRPKSMTVLNELATMTTVTVEWTPVEGAVRYKLVVAEQSMRKKKRALLRTISVDAAECCTVVIEELKPDTEYQITVAAVDENDVEGMVSVPVFATTASTAMEEVTEEEEGSS